MVEAYAGPLAADPSTPALPNVDPAILERMAVDVAPKTGGDTVTYTGIALTRHLNACRNLPTVGTPFWGHHPSLPPHVAKFELGTILAVRERTADDS